jgi:hypothetical protein
MLVVPSIASELGHSERGDNGQVWHYDTLELG